MATAGILTKVKKLQNTDSGVLAKQKVQNTYSGILAKLKVQNTYSGVLAKLKVQNTDSEQESREVTVFTPIRVLARSAQSQQLALSLPLSSQGQLESAIPLLRVSELRLNSDSGSEQTFSHRPF